jgi:Flp pilus assembly protein TadG
MRFTWLRKFRRDEDGFSLVFVGLGFMGFLAATMLAIDVGMLMTARSQAQNAADAGALAGATSLAFDDWDDRSPTGPAVVHAIAAAQANKVINETVSVVPADVEFPLDPTGQPSRVKVTVYRNAERGNPVETMIAKYFGISTANIAATATAEASPANAMTCVKPFTIPDKWIERNPVPKAFDPSDTFLRWVKQRGAVVLTSPADVYEPAYVNNTPPGRNSSYSGYNMETNRGLKLVLRAAQGNNIQPSFYFSLAMTSDTGGQDYRWNIANCNHSIYHWGDPLIQEPGSMEGPTIQGITELIARDPNAYWDLSTNGVKDSSFGDRQSPRIFPIPLYDPDYYNNNKENGRVANLRVANWIGFFVEYIGNGSEIHGRIIPIGGIRDKTWSGGTADMPKAIRLVQ